MFCLYCTRLQFEKMHVRPCARTTMQRDARVWPKKFDDTKCTATRKPQQTSPSWCNFIQRGSCWVQGAVQRRCGLHCCWSTAEQQEEKDSLRDASFTPQKSIRRHRNIILVEVCWKEWVMKNEIKYWILDFGFCESGLLLKKHGSARRTATKPSGIFSCCF